jgi:hypothetical protein
MTFPSNARPNHVSACLPPDAREILTRAATEARSIDNQVAREAHIEAAIARVQMKYPNFFRGFSNVHQS